MRRSLAETETTMYNGINEIYVNTAAKDGTLIAELMQYFENSNGINPKFEKLSYRVEQFKNDETEVTTMASVFDEYAQEVAEKVSQERRGVFFPTISPLFFASGGYGEDWVR